jgi:hypothetical protein
MQQQNRNRIRFLREQGDKMDLEDIFAVSNGDCKVRKAVEVIFACPPGTALAEPNLRTGSDKLTSSTFPTLPSH